jgi:uncharacterized protein (DUF1697 family)
MAIKYVAFLRAVNVGGRVIKMQELKKQFEALKFSNVETFIASGNVIFDAKEQDSSKLERKIEARLHDAFGYEVGAYVRTVDQVAEIARRTPFPPAAFTHGAVVYVVFLPSAPDAAGKRKVGTLATEIDEFHVAGSEVHWLCRKELEGRRSSGPPLGKVLGMSATVRNVRTIARLAERYRTATT